MGEIKKVRVAAVQMISENCEIEKNLNRALSFVEQASRKGAELVVLPEFLPTGYIFTTDIWNAAESKDGPTLTWLKQHSKRLGIYLGTSFLDAEGEDFFNTFVITTPEGNIAGKVRKQTPAAFEAYFTKGEQNSHVIDTALGKIGVGICYENQLAYAPRLMFEHKVDLMLMPHSCPLPTPSPLYPKKHVEHYKILLKDLAVFYAQRLGIPAIMINKCGPWKTPLPGLPFLTQDSIFPGLSAIVDSDGTTKAQLGNEEGVIVEDVTLDPSRKTASMPQTYGRWAIQYPWPEKLFPVVEAIGGLWYRLSTQRKEMARKIAKG